MKRLAGAFETLACVGIVLVLALAPTQWSLSPVGGVNICLADLLLLPVAGCWFLGVALTGRWRDLLRRPARETSHAGIVWLWTHALFALAALVSLRVAADRGDALKEAVQFLLYFIAAPLLFYDFIAGAPLPSRNRRIRILLLALLAPLAVHLPLAALQYRDAAGDILSVRGLFDNRNVLGGWLAVVTPVLFGLAAGLRRWWVWLLAALVLAAVFALTLSGAAYAALALALLLLAAYRGARLFLPLAAALALWQAAVLPRLPRENDVAHYRSVALYDDSGAPERRYPEWQAAASLILTHPLTGVGAGNYQREIGRYYDVVPNPTGPAEPDIQNLFLVIAATLGLPGLFALLALLGRGALAAAGAAATDPAAWRKWTAAGIVAGIGAFAGAAVWHPLIVRGIGLSLAALLALAYALADTSADRATHA